MKKPFNLRLPVLFACALIVGIVLTTVLAYFGLNGKVLSMVTIIALAACVPVVIFKGNGNKPLIFVIAVFIFILGGWLTYFYCVAFTATDVPLGETVYVVGRVREVGKTSNGVNYLLLDNVTVGGSRINHKVTAYLSDNAGDYCRAGYTVGFYAELEKQKLIAFGSVGYNATRGVKYVCFVGAGMRAKYGFSLFGTINSAITETLYAHLDSETAGICTALLTGNTQGLSDETTAAFRNGGVAHIFAVSGLHVGVVYGALGFVFKKIKLNRFISTALKIAFVAAYSGVCGFSPSSVRAVIACSVTGVASCTFSKYDGLNALSLAALVLLFINPLQLYDAGFLLSFSSMLGIQLLYKNFQRLFGFLPYKISRSLAVGLSAQIGSAPVLLTLFGNYSLAGVVLNFLLIPVISVVYVLLFAFTLIAAVLPATGVILPAVGAVAELISNLFVTVGFGGAVVCGSFSNWIYLPFAAVTLGLSGRLNFKALTRGVLVGGSVTALILIALGIQISGKNYFSFGSGYRGGSAIISTREGTVLVVTGNYRGNADFGADFNAVVVLSDDEDLSVLTRYDFDCDCVYLRGGEIPIPDLGGTPIYYSDDFEICGVSFAFGEKSLYIEYDGVAALVSLGYKGDEYQPDTATADFNLYCYAGYGAVLFANGRDYDLSVCGRARYEILSHGEYAKTCVLPKE